MALEEFQKLRKKDRSIITKDAHITLHIQEIMWFSLALCQEARIETKYISHYTAAGRKGLG